MALNASQRLSVLATRQHSAAESLAMWRAQFTAAGKDDQTPEQPAWLAEFDSAPLTQFLLLKPKSSQSSFTCVAVLASESSGSMPLKSLAKHVQCKELRLATVDWLRTQLQPYSAHFLLDHTGIHPMLLAQLVKPDKCLLLVDTELEALADQPVLIRHGGVQCTAAVRASDLLQTMRSLGLGAVQSLDVTALTLESATRAMSVSQAPSESFATLANPAVVAESSAAGRETKIGLEVGKDQDFSLWYQQVLTRSEMLDYYDVSGCYILRPWSFNIWKFIQEFFEKSITDMGVEPAYFPMFVSRRALEREKDHIEGFAPEVAWVTKAGTSDLQEPVAVRPTSETVMYPAFAKWIQSYRDLPLRLNQWCNVVRWEFKHPQPFLRTREFLWQEGHTAFATKAEADSEVREILSLYTRVYEELLAVPVVQGVKSEKEKFAGGLYTTTCEAFIPTTGRAIQGATSHCLGQNFSKMFDIMVEDENKNRVHVWQNSWGLTTRTIGVMVMVHGDDQGLVLPPRIAAIQVIVIPCGLTVQSTDQDRQDVEKRVQDVVTQLKQAGIRARADLRSNYTPGWKYNHWELKGVPVRLELGPKDIAKNESRAVRRDNRVKQQLSLTDLPTSIHSLLGTIQTEMLQRARTVRDQRIVRVTQWQDFVPALDNKNLVLIPWCEAIACEEQIKERSSRSEEGDSNVDSRAPSMGAKSLCIPFDQPTDRTIVPGQTKCCQCGGDAKRWALFGRSY